MTKRISGSTSIVTFVTNVLLVNNIDLFENVFTRILPQLSSIDWAAAVPFDSHFVFVFLVSFKNFVALDHWTSTFSSYVAMLINLVWSLCLTDCFIYSAQSLEFAYWFRRLYLFTWAFGEFRCNFLLFHVNNFFFTIRAVIFLLLSYLLLTGWSIWRLG